MRTSSGFELEEGKWIIIDDGNVFEGTFGMFQDAFGYGGTIEEAVEYFCNKHDCQYKILTNVDEIEARFKLFGWELNHE
jgi:hypothetical protein